MNGKIVTADIELRQSQSTELDRYMTSIIHQWSQTLCALGFILVPMFHILDWVMMPRELLPRFAAYRFVATLIVFGQYFLIYYTKPSRFSLLHGYFFNVIVGLCITLMTHDLGGFNSTYYAGLNLVMIAVCLLLPWEPIHSAINAALLVLLYVGINLFSGNAFATSSLINNLYFLSGTAVIAVSINYVKYRLIKEEFYLRAELATARDALWGEMEVAKRIQTALLPNKERIGGYVVAATMLPAEEVGGDYYDIIEAATGENWVAIGDVSGHGVESGLIMMMSQTSIFTTINRTAGYKPSSVLNHVNSVIKQNINRLGTDRYMTVSVIRLDHDKLVFAGKHQDLLIHRPRQKRTEFVPSKGTWIGILDEIGDYLTDTVVPVEDGDLIVLYTDGLTEAANAAGEMYGELRLQRTLDQCANLEPGEVIRTILHDVKQHMFEQRDDITIVALRRDDGLS
ncbi:MAG: PP2C family protein-serine/threonine phosphatase [bacterium]